MNFRGDTERGETKSYRPWNKIFPKLLTPEELSNVWNWKDIREHRDPKEAYHRPFTDEQGAIDPPLGGPSSEIEEGELALGCFRRVGLGIF